VVSESHTKLFANSENGLLHKLQRDNLQAATALESMTDSLNKGLNFN
jgi:hypothetical protein